MSKLIFISGLPGTGKSYLAQLLCAKYTFLHISSDRIRREINLRNHYGATEKMAVYRAMQVHLNSALQQGKSVIVDTTFYQKELRTEFTNVAGQYDIKPCWILTVADEETIRKRLSEERPDSQADYSVYLHLRDDFDVLQERYLEINTGRMNDEEMLRKVRKYCDLLSTS